jgi:ATP-dependent Clp endopeptidase proteolytic subunit ClpP
MAKVLIYGTIGRSWWDDEAVTAKSFIKDFDAAAKIADENNESIDVHINSPGGDVFEGIAIYNHIINSGKNVNTIVDGIAYSMGAIIAMAGTTVKAAKNSTLLLHTCSGYAYGNVGDMEQTIELMKALDSNLIGTVSDKTGMTEEDVKAKWFDHKDHTLTAKEAKEAGLIDELLGKAENVPTGSIEEVIAHFRRNPKSEKSFLDKIGDKISDLLKGQAVTPQTPTPPNTMNIKDQLAVLADASATIEAKNAAQAAIEGAFAATEMYTKEELDAQVADAVSAAHTEKESEITALQEQITALEQKPATPPSGKGGKADNIEDADTRPIEEILAEANQKDLSFY